jgi:hypothetical protein
LIFVEDSFSDGSNIQKAELYVKQPRPQAIKVGLSQYCR